MIWPFNSSETTPDRNDPTPRRTWRLLQVEPALTCNLACVMCPWRGEAGRSDGSGLMTQPVWAAIRPWLGEVETLDFTGGGEPLMHPRLPEWIRDSTAAGCRAGFLTNGSLLTPALARQLVDGGLDWIGFSVDGATADMYATIRPAADFNRLCDHIAHTVSLKREGRPQVILNFVMMALNVHQLADMVRLAADLGVDRLNFKQCDVIRTVNDGNSGLYGERRDKQIRSFEKQLRKARRLAERLCVETTAFAFSPDELPVCAQDPAS
jgi:MoaA/NifB/PqqE/SkfB family radical SAM enzyme